MKFKFFLTFLILVAILTIMKSCYLRKKLGTQQVSQVWIQEQDKQILTSWKNENLHY